MIIYLSILFLSALTLFSIWLVFFGISSKEYFFLLFGLAIPLLLWIITFYLRGANKITFIDNGIIIKNVFFINKTILYHEIIDWAEKIIPRVTYNSMLIRTKSGKTIIFSVIDEKGYEELRFQLRKKLKDKEIL